MALEWGVTPLAIPEATDVEDLWRGSIAAARASGPRRAGRPGRDHGRARAVNIPGSTNVIKVDVVVGGGPPRGARTRPPWRAVAKREGPDAPPARPALARAVGRRCACRRAPLLPADREATSQTRDAARRARARGAPLARAKHDARARGWRGRRASTRSPAQARRLGYVRPGEHLFIVEGIAEWRRRTPARRLATRAYRDGDGRSGRRRRTARPRAARLPARRRPLPLRPAGGDRAGALRRRGRAVPDDVLPDVPRTSSPPSRASRRPAASSGGARGRGGSARCAATSSGRRPSSARSAASSRRDDGRTAARRSSSGSAASAQPGRLKCLHAHVAFALARPGYELGEAILEEVPERWPRSAAASSR